MCSDTQDSFPFLPGEHLFTLLLRLRLHVL